MARPRVIVAPHFRKMAEIFAPEDLARLGRLCEVVWGRDEPMPQADFEAALKDAAALVFGSWPWGRDAIRKAGPGLRAVFAVGGGHSHKDLDYDACFERGIFLGSVAPSMARQVSEMALGLTLAATRGIALNDRRFRTGQEVYLHKGCADHMLLYEKTVGFVGCGSLARGLQPLLEPFRVRILGYDPWLPPGHLRRRGIEPADLETLFDASDVIYVLAVPTPENKGMVTRALLERIRPGRCLVLMSRAHLVDFDALTDLVLAGRFRAAIDVFPKEPVPPDHPIRRAEGAVLSAHCAGATPEGLREIGLMVVEDLEQVFRDLPPVWMQPAWPGIRRRLVGAKEARR